MNNLVSIVIPTRNEEGNIERLLIWGLWQASLIHELKYEYEAIVVDDSSDETAQIATSLGARVIKGKGKGLGQAIIDGINASNGDVVVVMDADLSHNPHAIPGMIKPIIQEGADMTIGSRYVKGGSNPHWSLIRRIISRGACLLALPITSVKDATSGFFAFKKEILSGIELNPSSWKIMLEVLIKAEPLLVQELPIQFDERNSGKSKFDTKQTVAYVKHLTLLTLHKYRKFIKYCIVGGTGALIHLGIVWTLTDTIGLWYMLSSCIAIGIAVIWNFNLNLFWTFTAGAKADEANYDWVGFHNGNPVQKWWKQSIAKTIWKWIPNSNSLLNVGCGSSANASKYPDSINIDVNQEKLDYLKSKLPLINVKNMSAESLEFKDETFAHVICIELVEHLQEPEKTISEIARVLKQEGEAIIATPDYNRKWWLLAEKFTPAKEQHIYHFTRKKLNDMCKEFGLICTKYKYVAGCDYIGMYRKGK